MEKYMLDRDRTGSFGEMYEHSVKSVLKREPRIIAECAGVAFDEARQAFVFESLRERMAVSYPQCQVTFSETGETPFWQWQLVLLHYLATADGAPLGEEFIAFRNMQQGIARKVGFESDTAKALIDAFGDKPVERVNKACEALGAVISKANADVRATFYVCPRYPVTVQIWMADEEMPAEAQVLFNARALHYLPTEGAEYAGSLVVEFLTKQYKLMFP